jgi:DNA transformation protein and related proteins
VDAEVIREIFEPVGRVQFRRMFGGHGIYLDGLIFALEIDGDIFMKTDDVNRGFFESRGSRRFTYEKLGKVTLLPGCWSLPAAAYDDADELRELTRSSLAASERARERKAIPRKMKFERAPTATSGSTHPAANRPAG